MTAPRRNDPCPCGSGRRYKECHGRLDSAPATADALIREALQAHQQGRVDEAERRYREVLAREPAHAIATHYMGLAAWQRGDAATAEERMRAAIALDGSVGDFHNNLGLLLRDTGRPAEAAERFREALRVDPRAIEAANNLGLALEAAGRWDDALAAYRDAIEAQPQFAAARQNLARVLLTLGQFAEGWNEYRWRLPARGQAWSETPSLTPGSRIALIAEQGLGDVLFFLRFAPELVQRGAKLAFRGDARLNAMLARTGLFELGVDGPEAAIAELQPVPVGDLPALLQVNDASRFPAALALTPLPERIARVRDALTAHGPAPYAAITWRAGIASTGPSHTQLKQIDVELLGSALKGIPATCVSVQRLPQPGEHERLAGALGAPVADFSACNDDLEDMLALMAEVQDYIGVSNANTYLHAGAGGAMHVLVAHPPEWRWMADGDESPWFERARLFRQDRDGSWDRALEELRAALG